MAKNSTVKSLHVPDVAPDPIIPGTGLAVAAPPPALSAEEKKALGDAFLAKFKVKEDAEAALEAALEAARRDMSASVEAIVKGMGHKGPFTIGGRKFSAKQSKSNGLYTMSREKDVTDLG